jgi:hypothetical protein
MKFAQIVENGEQQDLSAEQVAMLLASGIIYDSGENYYHIENGKSWADVDAALKVA